MSEFEKLVAALIGYAYDTGYYSGKLEDATPHHLKAIGDRVRAQYALLAQGKALVAAAQRLRSELDPSSMADEALYRLIDAALAPFEEAADGTSG